MYYLTKKNVAVRKQSTMVHHALYRPITKIAKGGTKKQKSTTGAQSAETNIALIRFF